MFKSSENLRLAADMRALQRVASPWREARATWFDGTPESLEARLAATDKVLTHARSGFTAAHLELTREALAARRELIEARHHLLNDFLDDGARAFKGSKRVAGPEGFADWDRGAWSTPSLMSGPPSREEIEEAHRKADPWGDRGAEDPYWVCPNCGADDNSVHRDPDCPSCGTSQEARIAFKSPRKASIDEACEDCGADAGEKCRPWCTGEAKHDDEKKKSKKTSSVSDFDDELMYFDLS